MDLITIISKLSYSSKRRSTTLLDETGLFLVQKYTLMYTAARLVQPRSFYGADKMAYAPLGDTYSLQQTNQGAKSGKQFICIFRKFQKSPYHSCCFVRCTYSVEIYTHYGRELDVWCLHTSAHRSKWRPATKQTKNG